MNALRGGTVPANGLGALAVGLERFHTVVDQELDAVADGLGIFKAVRGEYGCGKTFFARWVQERAQERGFATAEVQISETETPLHRLETVYRRLVEHLSTDGCPMGALRSIIDTWFYTLEEKVLEEEGADLLEPAVLVAKTKALMEERLLEVTRHAPAFSAALRGYHQVAEDDNPIAEGLIAWLGGQPNVTAGIKRKAGVKGDLDHFGALSFLRGLLTILRDSGHPGLVLVLDEVETLQRVRSDVRDKGLNSLRQWIDEVDRGHFPGLYLMITGTTSFFEGHQGVQRLAPLAGRLATDFTSDTRFDNTRAIQVRLHPFDRERLIAVGILVRDLFTATCPARDRLLQLADDQYVADLADAVADKLGGKVGIAPRIFLKKLVAEVLDRIEQFPDFQPRRDYALTISDGELAPAERSGRRRHPDEFESKP